MVEQEKKAHDKVHFQIITPQGIVVNDEVDYVVLPGEEGDLTILPEHIPIIARLRVGIVEIHQGDVLRYFFVAGGVLKITADKAIALSKASEFAGDIDRERALQAKQRAEERLKSLEEEKDIARAKAALTRALTRLEAIELHNK